MLRSEKWQSATVMLKYRITIVLGVASADWFVMLLICFSYGAADVSATVLRSRIIFMRLSAPAPILTQYVSISA
jgi:hypothetical protein